MKHLQRCPYCGMNARYNPIFSYVNGEEETYTCLSNLCGRTFTEDDMEAVLDSDDSDSRNPND